MLLSRALFLSLLLTSSFRYSSDKSAAQVNGERELLALHRDDRRAHFDHSRHCLREWVRSC